MWKIAEFLRVLGVNGTEFMARSNLRINMSSLPWVHAREFEGPSDQLLEEARRQNVASEDPAMAPLVVAGFLEYIAAAADRNLNLDIDCAPEDAGPIREDLCGGSGPSTGQNRLNEDGLPTRGCTPEPQKIPSRGVNSKSS